MIYSGIKKIAPYFVPAHALIPYQDKIYMYAYNVLLGDTPDQLGINDK